MKQVNLNFFIDDNDDEFLDNLLERHDNRVYLDDVLERLPYEDRINLYQYLKYHYYYRFHAIEKEIIAIYKRHGITLPQVFIEYPTPQKCVYDEDEKLNKLLDKMKEEFCDTDPETLECMVSEFRRKAQFDINRACSDIMRLINIKREYPEFKIMVDGNCNISSYNNITNELRFNKYMLADFTHELSHVFSHLTDGENDDILEFYDFEADFKYIPEVTNSVKDYLLSFHEIYEEKETFFTDLYYREIDRCFGNLENYIEHLKQDIIDSKAFEIIFKNKEDEKEPLSVDFANIYDCINKIVDDERGYFVKILLVNYFYEELCLEGFIDAFFKGKVGEHKYSSYALCYHSPEYFFKYNKSFNECIAFYETIKYSSKAEGLIGKLREIFGNGVINIIEDHISSRRLTEPSEYVKEKVGEDN